MVRGYFGGGNCSTYLVVDYRAMGDTYKMNILKVGWIEFLYAYLMGAPVKTRKGRIYQRKTFGQVAQKILDAALWGIDLSKWQGVVDFVKLKAGGIKFLILRCSYGIWRDEKFDENISKAVAAFIGWLFGVYHYYDPRYSPQAQADALLATINPHRQYVRRVWIDLEFTWGGSYEASKYWQQFAQLILSAGYEIGVYTRKTWWDSRVGTLAAWFGKYPLWAAQYNTTLNMIPAGWTIAHIWQDGIGLTDNDFPAGTMQSKEYDHDIMDDEFYKTEQGGTVTPPVGGTMKEGTALVDLNIRSGVYPATVVGILNKGDKAYGVIDPVSGWLIIQWIVRVGGARQDFTGWCSALPQYLSVVDYVPAAGLPDIPYIINLGDDVTYVKQTITGILKPVK